MSLRQTLTALLRDAPDGMTLADLADTAGVPPTTARFHLEALVADGVIEQGTAAPTGRGRPRAVYRTRHRMDPAGPRNYLALARSLTEALAGVPDAEARAVRAGERWGETFAAGRDEALPTLLAVLDDSGFAPEARPPAAGERFRIALGHCPFLEVARSDPQITCAVHRGLIRGVLRGCGDDPEAADLIPFVGGDHCLATIAEKGRAPAPPSQTS